MPEHQEREVPLQTRAYRLCRDGASKCWCCLCKHRGKTGLARRGFDVFGRLICQPPVHVEDCRKLAPQTVKHDHLSSCASIATTGHIFPAWPAVDTTFNARFQLSSADESTCQWLYAEIPNHHLLQNKKRNSGKGGEQVIGRMYSVSPEDVE